jgi:UDP-N-acetylmuramoyl-L-alanyl-D-glutamate--2,6-diaminopimelate ligase
MLEAGDRACAMEVSSHAMTLRRADAIHFEVALFTNLTQDHLDFHADMEDYFLAKRKLFEAVRGPLSSTPTIPTGRLLAEEFESVSLLRRGGAAGLQRPRGQLRRRPAAEFRVGLPEGGEIEVAPGCRHFNVAKRARRLRRGAGARIEPETAAGRAGAAARVPGRFEPIDEGQGFTVLVDYAHNAGFAGERAAGGTAADRGPADRGLRRRGRPRPRQASEDGPGRGGALGPRRRHLRQPALRGPGGDRGRSRRRQRGRGGEVEVDRRTAIALALGRAAPGDTVVIAGKGHEQGQEFEGGRKVPFDDREVARQELRKLGSPA